MMSHDFKNNFSSWQTKKSPHLQNNLIQPLWSINHFWLVGPKVDYSSEQIIFLCVILSVLYVEQQVSFT